MAVYDEKGWWKSRTVWTGVIGGAFAIAAALGVVPADMDQETVLNSVLAVVSILTIVLRFGKKETVVLTKPAA